MNITEANAVSRMLRWLIGDQAVTVERAREDAEWLAARSYNVLTAGITQEQIAERWLRPTAPSTPAQMSPQRLDEILGKVKAARELSGPDRAIASKTALLAVEELAEEVQRVHGEACAVAIDRDHWHDTYQQAASAHDEFLTKLLQVLPGDHAEMLDAYAEVLNGIERLKSGAAAGGGAE